MGKLSQETPLPCEGMSMGAADAEMGSLLLTWGSLGSFSKTLMSKRMGSLPQVEG